MTLAARLDRSVQEGLLEFADEIHYRKMLAKPLASIERAKGHIARVHRHTWALPEALAILNKAWYNVREGK